MMGNCSSAFNLASARYVVAADSRQLSVTLLPPSKDLLMVYEDSSKQVNIMHGCSDFGDVGWQWRNMTGDFEAVLKQSETRDSYLVATCRPSISGYQGLYCFSSDKSRRVSRIFSISFSVASPGILTIGRGILLD